MAFSDKNTWLSAVFSLLVLLGFSGCKQEDPYTKYENQQRDLEENYIQEYLTGNNITNFTKTPSGLYYIPKQPGTGALIQNGNVTTMDYIGYILQTGQKFDSSYDTGVPLTFTVGKNQVIRGWDEGTTLMKKDEEATLIIPSHLGYGRYSSGNIQGGSILLFNIKVKDVK